MKIESELKVNPIYPIEKNNDKSDEEFRKEQFLKTKKILEQKESHLGKNLDFYA